MPNKIFDYRQSGGLVSDSNEFTLLDQEWSDMNNVRIHNRAVSKISGNEELIGLDNTPRHSIFIDGYNNDFYYYIDTDGETHRVNAAGSETEVTKGVGGTKDPLDTDVQYQMNAIHGGYTLLVNDGSHTPQYISSVGSGTDTTELTDIPGWDYSDTYQDVKATVIRPFKYLLIAMGITQTVTADSEVERNAGTVRISNQAAPGALPTWDPQGDNADTADEFELAQNGEIIDGVSLADRFIIFTRNEIYSLRTTNSSTTPIAVSKELSGRGMLAQNCAVEYFGKLFVVGPEDIYVYQTGAGTKSISDERVRDYFFNNLHPTYYANTFVRHNEREDEIWVCYPGLDSDDTYTPAIDSNDDQLYIGNFLDNSLTQSEIDNLTDGDLTPVMRMTVSLVSNHEDAELNSNRATIANVNSAFTVGDTLRFTKQDGSASITARYTGSDEGSNLQDGIIGLDSDITSVIIDGTDDGGLIEILTASGENTTGFCDKALIWNYTHNTWTKRDLPNVFPGSSGPLIADSEFLLDQYYLQLPSEDSDKIQSMDRGTTFDGTAFTGYVERKGLDVNPDTLSIGKDINEVSFLITGSGETTVKLRATDTPGRPVDFDSTTDRRLKTFTYQIDGDMPDLKIQPRSEGKFLNWRIEGEDDWNLHRIIVDYNDGNERAN